jgi:hypothetical protein
LRTKRIHTYYCDGCNIKPNFSVEASGPLARPSRRMKIHTVVTDATKTSTQIISELVALASIVVTPFIKRYRIQNTAAAFCTVTL